MNAQVSTSIVTEPPVWFITGCSTGLTSPSRTRSPQPSRRRKRSKDFMAGQAVARAADFPKPKAGAVA